MEVRRAVVDDAGGIAAARLSNGPAHDDSGASADYCRHLIEHEHLWVAVDGGRVVGFGGGVDVGGARLLSDLFVHADEHGRGVGKALLGEVLRGATHRFTFATHDPAAVPLYERVGMVRRCAVLSFEVPTEALDGRGESARLTARPVDASVAAALEVDATGIDRAATYRYWAARTRSHTLAVSDQRGVVAVCAVRSGERWTRIEHLALTATAGDGGPDIERDVIAAVVASVPGTELHLSVLEQRPVTSLLLQRGATVVDTAVFMSTDSGLLSDRVVVVHSGFG